MVDEDASTRFTLTVYMLGAVVALVLVVMILSAFNVTVPEFVSGVVVMGFMTMLRDAYGNYFKAREAIQAARIDASKCVETKKNGDT